MVSLSSLGNFLKKASSGLKQSIKAKAKVAPLIKSSATKASPLIKSGASKILKFGGQIGKKASPLIKSGVSKIARSTLAVGKKTVPMAKGLVGGIFGKITSGFGVIGSFTKQLAIYEGIRRTFDAIKDPGFVLFILGLLTFFFKEHFASPFLAVFIGSIFLFYSSFFILKGKGFLITFIFWIWYIFFGGTTDLRSLIHILLPLTIGGMILHGLIVRLMGRGTFFQGAGEELAGLIPIAFFFFDLGLLSFLTKPPISLPITPLTKNLILYTPWWALLGLFTTKKENFLISLTKVVGIFYIFSIVFFSIVPEVFITKESGFLRPEELLQAKKETQKKTPSGENPFLSTIFCVFSSPTKIQDCVNKRQEEAKLRYFCQKIKKLKPGTPEYLNCLKEERKKKLKEKTQFSKKASGTIDPTIKESFSANFKVGEYFPKLVYREEEYDPSSLTYPLQLEIKNPRRQEGVEVQLHCFFKKGTALVKGKVKPESFSLKGEKKEIKNILCTPEEQIKGSYTLIFQADLFNLKTSSRLRRIFVNKEMTEEEIKELEKTYFSGKKGFSEAPPDFARLNFGFGEPETNPIIKPDQSLILLASIENLGPGKILAIKDYQIKLPGFEVTHGEGCFKKPAGKEIALPKEERWFSQQQVPLLACFIRPPSELENPPKFILKEFTAELIYDYQLEKKIPIKVDLVGSS